MSEMAEEIEIIDESGGIIGLSSTFRTCYSGCRKINLHLAETCNDIGDYWMYCPTRRRLREEGK